MKIVTGEVQFVWRSPVFMCQCYFFCIQSAINHIVRYSNKSSQEASKILLMALSCTSLIFWRPPFKISGFR